MTTQRAVSASYLKVILDALTAKGVDIEPLKQEAHITAELINSAEAFINAEQYQSLISAAIEAANDPCLGLYIGKNLEVGTHGVLSYAALGMPTVWDCLKLGEEFARIRSPILKVELALEQQDAVISFDTQAFSGEVYQFVIEGAICAYHAIMSLVFDQLPSMQIKVRYAAPASLEQYQAMLGFKLEFNAHKNQIRLPRACVEASLQTANPFIAKELEKQIHQQIEAMEEVTLVDKIKLLLDNRIDKSPSQEPIASSLNMSMRTLRRQLKEAGTSYQAVLNSYRSAQAKRYLDETEHSVEEIAFLLGFSSASHFSYAFKQWTGIAPKFYRSQGLKT